MKFIKKLYASFLVRRLLKMVGTILFVMTLTFFMIRLMPGNPMELYIQQQVNVLGMSYAEARDQAAALFSINIDDPLWKQYWDYLKNLSKGDMGMSLVSPGTPVVQYIKEYLPWTLFSVGTSIILSFIIGTTIGMYIAYKRGTWYDHLISWLASIMTAIPNYLVGILLLIFIGVHLRIVPISLMRGTAPPGMEPWTFQWILGIFGHAFMPMATYILTTVGAWILQMKNTTMSTLGEDYVLVARARGLSERKIITQYVGRNAILPLFTTLVLQLGLLIGGAPLIESVFMYKGIGWALGTALAQRDYPVMQAIFLCITIAVIVANFLADLFYSKLDPRIKTNAAE